MSAMRARFGLGRNIASGALALMVFAYAASAGAQPTQDTERAKMLFSSGAQAYAAGQFDAAIQAFSEANHILPRPAIVYSLAQAHRRQYFVDRKKEHLTAAIASFRAYIEQVPDGGRRADAALALSELEPMLARMGEGAGGAQAPEAKEPATEPARLMITTQPSGAWMTIDGRERKQTPFAAEVTPGTHRVHVTLDGYFDEDREILAIDRTLVPVPLELRERPAHLTVNGPKGCDVSIDGRPAGTTPQLESIEVSAGTHLVVVSKNGYKAYSEDVDFRRDERKTVAVSLEATGQRIVARSLLISGGVLVVAGGVFSLVALNRQQAALDVRDRQRGGQISADDPGTLDEAKSARNRWTTAAVGAFSVGGVALATNLVFYVFDRPMALQPRMRPEERRKTPQAPTEPAEMTMVPVLGPTFGGAALTGRF